MSMMTMTRWCDDSKTVAFFLSFLSSNAFGWHKMANRRAHRALWKRTRRKFAGWKCLCAKTKTKQRSHRKKNRSENQIIYIVMQCNNFCCSLESSSLLFSRAHSRKRVYQLEVTVISPSSRSLAIRLAVHPLFSTRKLCNRMRERWQMDSVFLACAWSHQWLVRYLFVHCNCLRAHSLCHIERRKPTKRNEMKERNKIDFVEIEWAKIANEFSENFCRQFFVSSSQFTLSLKRNRFLFCHGNFLHFRTELANHQMNFQFSIYVDTHFSW